MQIEKSLFYFGILLLRQKNLDCKGFMSTLPIFEKYGMLFAMKEPSCLLLTDQRIELFKEFLVCF